MKRLFGAFATIGVISSMYLISRALYYPLLSLFRNNLDAFGWACRLVDVFLGVLAGALLTKLLSGRFLLLRILAIPVVIAIGVPVWLYFQMADYGAQRDFGYPLAFAAHLVLIVYALGMLVGALLVMYLRRRAASTPPPNTSLERTREG